MNVKFDFVLHWLWSIVFAVLTLSGLTMIGAKYGWILNYDIASADLIHRILAAVFVMLTFIAIAYTVLRELRNERKNLPWFVIGMSGYQLFTLITTLIFIITGAIIWICMGSNISVTAFALYVHEKLTFVVVASLIWHIYDKSHALVWPEKRKKSLAKNQAADKKKRKEVTA